MTACPRCGARIEPGKAYCSNPACGAVTGGEAPAGERRITKKYSFVLKADFALLARLAAALITLLAAALIYFTRK